MEDRALRVREGYEGGGRGDAAPSFLDQLSDSLKVFSTGWKEITKEDEAYTIVKKEEYNSFENGKYRSEIYLNMTQKVTSSLSQKG